MRGNRSPRQSCRDKALKLDLYRETFNFQLPNKTATYRTLIGAIASCVTIMLVGLFAIYKLTSLVTFDDYRVMKN